MPRIAAAETHGCQPSHFTTLHKTTDWIKVPAAAAAAAAAGAASNEKYRASEQLRRHVEIS